MFLPVQRGTFAGRPDSQDTADAVGVLEFDQSFLPFMIELLIFGEGRDQSSEASAKHGTFPPFDFLLIGKKKQRSARVRCLKTLAAPRERSTDPHP